MEQFLDSFLIFLKNVLNKKKKKKRKKEKRKTQPQLVSERQLVLSSLWPQGTLFNCSHLTELIGGAARETQGRVRELQGSRRFSHKAGVWGQGSHREVVVVVVVLEELLHQREDLFRWSDAGAAWMCLQGEDFIRVINK